VGGDGDTALCALYDRDSDSPDRPAVEFHLQGTKGGQRHLQWIGDEVQKPSKELRNEEDWAYRFEPDVIVPKNHRGQSCHGLIHTCIAKV